MTAPRFALVRTAAPVNAAEAMPTVTPDVPEWTPQGGRYSIPDRALRQLALVDAIGVKVSFIAPYAALRRLRRWEPVTATLIHRGLRSQVELATAKSGPFARLHILSGHPALAQLTGNPGFELIRLVTTGPHRIDLHIGPSGRQPGPRLASRPSLRAAVAALFNRFTRST